MVRDNGRSTYFASDIAYHLQKRERGFENLVDILGSDHHGYVARVRAGLQAMGEPPECLEVDLMQFVVLFRGEQKVQMSTRSGEFVTLRQLREEVGDDAAGSFLFRGRMSNTWTSTWNWPSLAPTRTRCITFSTPMHGFAA